MPMASPPWMPCLHSGMARVCAQYKAVLQRLARTFLRGPAALRDLMHSQVHLGSMASWGLRVLGIYPSCLARAKVPFSKERGKGGGAHKCLAMEMKAMEEAELQNGGNLG